MPKYRVLERSFINNGLREEGEIVDITSDPDHPERTMLPGKNLEPLDAAGQQLADERKATESARGVHVPDLVRQKTAAVGGDPDAVDAAVEANVAAAAAEAALQGKQVIVDGKVITSPAEGLTGAGDLV